MFISCKELPVSRSIRKILALISTPLACVAKMKKFKQLFNNNHAKMQKGACSPLVWR